MRFIDFNNVVTESKIKFSFPQRRRKATPSMNNKRFVDLPFIERRYPSFRAIKANHLQRAALLEGDGSVCRFIEKLDLLSPSLSTYVVFFYNYLSSYLII